MKKVLSTKLLSDESKKNIPPYIDLLEHNFIEIYHKKLEEYSFLLEESSPTIITSKNGAEAIRPLIDKGKRCFNEVYCVGENTALNLVELGIHPSLIAYSAVGLAEALSKAGKVKRVNYFCGNLKNDKMLQVLLNASIDIFEIQAYQVEFMSIKIDEDIDAVLFYSPSGVKSFYKKNTLSENQIAFTIGNTTKNFLESIFKGQIIVANQPKMVEVLNAALDFYKN